MSYIPDGLRQNVLERAQSYCEYCRIHARYMAHPHEIDHVYAEKHRGETISENLCLCCLHCNRCKGSDLSSIDSLTDKIVPLYHPRRDRWVEHFLIRPNGQIEGRTPEGRVTVFLLNFNNFRNVAIRASLIALNRYPEEKSDQND